MKICLDGEELKMLTRKQIEKIAVKNKVSLFTQERDYIQVVYLSILYSNTRCFIFKGGTCLRTVYHSPRYSEDLDFNSDLDEKSAYKILETAALELKYFGITATIKDKRMSRSGFGFALSYKGPLYDGRDITKGRVRIDVSLRKEQVVDDVIPVQTEYDDVKIFIIRVATLKDIFAEKVRALLIRGIARDLYDLWFLLEGGVEVDIDLINSKLSLYGRSYSSENMVNCIASMKNNWTKDLKTLLGSPVPYEVAAGLVVDRLNIIQ